LAKTLDLNVLFDSESFRPGSIPKISIELKNVTAAKALDYIFLQQGLFFQKVGPRTIIVVSQNRRQNYQQLVLRTFYLANADPTEVQKIVQTAIPAQPGRTPTITLVDKSTNSITVRDTTENIRLIGKLINSLDKDRAEVVMDVAIYEVSKNDLLKFGTQIGDSATLSNLGGTNSGVVGTANNIIAGRSSFGLGVIIPAISFQALQTKDNSKLIASTQIHAFNNEDSSARIGQRVPVRSATISNGFNNNNGNTPNNNNGGGFVGDVINYEQVGLTLKFKPIVFPNQDVQVTMEIESKDVAGASTLTPTFTERTIKGTARVQNNKTLLLASVAQGVESNGRTGLPLLGLIPVLGRLFTAPTRDNRQVDIVIAITRKLSARRLFCRKMKSNGRREVWRRRRAVRSKR
jgi:general secretion pathway protein D